MISAYIIITLCTGGDNEAAILAGGHVVFVGYQWEWGMKPRDGILDNHNHCITLHQSGVCVLRFRSH